jgi:hypothetical protein
MKPGLRLVDLTGAAGMRRTHAGSASWGFLPIPSHVMLGMSTVISSTRSCQVRYVSPDVATLLCIGTSHDREGQQLGRMPTGARHPHEREGKKDQSGLVLAHDGDTLFDPGAYFFL